jgi:hypothetical protein
MTRRHALGLAATLLTRAAAETPAAQTIRGKLRAGKQPVLSPGSGEPLRLQGDKSTMLVLGDERLQGADLEVTGQRQADGALLIGPIHTRAMKVHRGGKALLITYWCEVCSIRTYAPGICVCCQAETELDLRESLDP